MAIDPISYEARGINPERLRAILEHAGRSILDVGCGSGAYVLKLADRYEIFGVDVQHYETWNQMPHLFAASEASELNFDDNSFDTILLFETLEHLPNPGRALEEYYRVCRKNLILSVPNCEITLGMRQSHMIYYHWIDRTHVNFFSMETITRTVQEAGFKVSKNYYINEISLMPLLTEAFNIPRSLTTVIIRWFLRRQRNYSITCLIVGDK